jgi:hypothetical protein
MSNKNSDTSAIDEKKDTMDSSEQNITKGIGKFFFSLIVVFIILFTHFSLGGCLLYWCKLAQSNILPTEENCYPYTKTPVDIKPISSNIFTTNTEPQQSMKIEFPYNTINAKNTVLDVLRKYKDTPGSSVVGNYFATIIEKIICMNYNSINTYFNFLNNVPEMLTVIIGPIITSFFLTFLFIFDNLYFIYLWFSQMHWFFKESNKKDDDSVEWKNVTMTSPFNYSLGILMSFIFFGLFFFVAIFALPVLPFVGISWAVLSLFGYKSTMYNKTTDITDIVKDVLKNYKITLSTIFSIFVVISTFSNFGSLAGGISIGLLLLVYGGLISIDLFNKEELSPNFSALVSNDQAKKVCRIKEKPEHGYLYNLLLGQKGGGNDLVKGLKQIGKKIQETKVN